MKSKHAFPIACWNRRIYNIQRRLDGPYLVSKKVTNVCSAINFQSNQIFVSEWTATEKNVGFEKSMRSYSMTNEKNVFFYYDSGWILQWADQL